MQDVGYSATAVDNVSNLVASASAVVGQHISKGLLAPVPGAVQWSADRGIQQGPRALAEHRGHQLAREEEHGILLVCQGFGSGSGWDS